MSRLWLGLLILLAGAGCHGHETAPPRGETATVARIREASEAFLRAQVEQSWERWLSGINADPGAPALGREWLFTPTTLDILRRAIRHEPRGDNRRALHHLHALLVGEQVKLATLDIDEKLWTLTRSPVTVGNESLAYRDLPPRLAREPDAGLRRAWSDAALPVLAAMEPLIREREAEVRRVAQRLGYNSRLALSSEVRQYDLTRVESLAQTLLDQTEALYLSLLDELAEVELGLHLAELRPADIPRLLYSSRYELAFPADDMLNVVETTVADLGIRLASLPIQIDARPLESKHPRPACFPIIVPTDIRLSLKPAGGATDYAALLHEVGHALHFAKTRTLGFELQVLGDASSSEALAFLFETLADDPAWLSERLDMREPMLSAYTRLAVLKRLLMVRRYAARVLVELETQSGKHPGAGPRYRELLSRAYGFPLEAADTAHAFVDQDPFLEAADYVRGWVVAAALSADLKRRFGARWWQNPAAAERLDELWAAGQRDTADELALKVDAKGIGAEALLRWTAETLAASGTGAPPRSVRSQRER